MKILYTITSTTVGGAEKTLLTLLSGLDKTRYAPSAVVCLKPLGPVAEKIKQLGIETISLDMGYLPSPAGFMRLRQIIAEQKPDIIHSFLFRAIQFSRWAKSGQKLIASPRVNYRTRSLPVLLTDKAGKHLDDLVLCESASSADYLIKSQGYPPDKVSVIRNGIDASAWEQDPAARKEIRFITDLKPEETLILACGRLDLQKGFEHLINAMALAAKTNPEIKLIIAGTGPLESKLLKLISDLKLDRNVRLAGEQNNIRAWLSAADIFVLPSLWEGIPNSLLEAMSAGKACIASAVDGVSEAAQDGRDCLLVPPGNAQILSEKIIMLTKNAELRKQLGTTAKEKINKDFSLSSMIAAYQNAYDSVWK